jgi:hypothetical protein
VFSDLIRPVKLYKEVKKYLGPGFIAWEPESMWMEFQGLGLELSDANKDKLLACVTLVTTSQFYWNIHAFSSTVAAFNELPFLPGYIEEHEPKHIAWAVVEARNVLAVEDQEFYPLDIDIEAYVGVCFHREGFVLVPDILRDSQDDLDRLNVNHELKWKVQDRVDDPVVETQLARLKEIDDYIVYRINASGV